MKEKVFTNCFLVKTDEDGNPKQVCLAMKKRGFGQGLWNGSGGKPFDNEPIEKTAKREVEEEFRVKVQQIEKRGEIVFVLRKEEKRVTMHTFWGTDWEGDPAETEEMKPRWFPIKDVPYHQMWESDKEWLPMILSGKKIRAKFTYASEGGSLETRVLTQVESFG